MSIKQVASICIATSIAFLFFNITVVAQRGNIQVQPSAQVIFPLGDLSNSAKTGFGVAAKGMYGFGDKPQQSTLEIGYNRFAVKNLPSGLEAYYDAIPIYLGYRYILGNFILEPQAGISVNKVVAAASGQFGSETNTNFAWATGIGYTLHNIELDVRYQNSSIKNYPDLTFVSIRLAYNFDL